MIARIKHWWHTRRAIRLHNLADRSILRSYTHHDAGDKDAARAACNIAQGYRNRAQHHLARIRHFRAVQSL